MSVPTTHQLQQPGVPTSAYPVQRCDLMSNQFKSSQAKTLPRVKSIKSSQISTTDRTHARTGPETQRAQAHNHTQNSNQVCMSLRSRRLDIAYLICPPLSHPQSPRFVRGLPVRADAGCGSDVCLLGLRWEQDLGGAGLRGPGRVATLDPLSTTLHGRAPVRSVPVPYRCPGGR